MKKYGFLIALALFLSGCYEFLKHDFILAAFVIFVSLTFWVYICFLADEAFISEYDSIHYHDHVFVGDIRRPATVLDKCVVYSGSRNPDHFVILVKYDDLDSTSWEKVSRIHKK